MNRPKSSRSKTKGQSTVRNAMVEEVPTILFVHGVGEPVEEGWNFQWEDKLGKTFAKYFPKLNKPMVDGRAVETSIKFEAADYHDLFQEEFSRDDLEKDELVRALGSLGLSKNHHGFGGMLRGTRGLSAMVETLHWTAAMLVRWTSDPVLRRLLRQRLRKRIEETNPTVVAAHSLGSVIAYDLFREDKEMIRNRSFISFGSQIGNAFVRNVFRGRLEGLRTARYWLHLYNPHDAVFTSEIRLHGDDTLHESEKEGDTGDDPQLRRNFFQVQTPFDNKDPLDHVAVSTGEGSVGYLDTYEAVQLVWPRVFRYSKTHDTIRRQMRNVKHLAMETPDHRALLVGVDHYRRDDIPSLAGCTNDTFLISQILQEQGFPVENIRLLHNDRATGAAIRDRLDWLLDDVDPGEFRFFFFSGHGHQLESYGPNEVADRLDECLCPHDYDYSVASAILDDHLFNLYAQLPYKSQFVVVLDCCHSGGMARSGSARVRGLTAPMDVAHRGLKWEYDKEHGNSRWARRSTGSKTQEELTGRRAFGEATDRFKVHAHLPATVRDDRSAAAYYGHEGTVRRLFRALSLRQKLKLKSGPKPGAPARVGETSPYMPVILQACAEDDVALEHTDGMMSHGAFTFCLARAFRKLQPMSSDGSHVTVAWRNIIGETQRGLRELGYTQTPQLLAARDQRNLIFPKPKK